MTILPHLLLTTVGVQALGLQGQEAALAYAFGYGIDVIDHPIKLPLYMRKNGKKNEKHYHWRTPFQEPIALAWIIPISFYCGTYVPASSFVPSTLVNARNMPPPPPIAHWRSPARPPPRPPAPESMSPRRCRSCRGWFCVVCQRLR